MLQDITLSAQIKGTLENPGPTHSFPFTDSEAYEPLEDFLNVVKEQRPKVFILIGPFVDAKNELIVNNNFQVQLFYYVWLKGWHSRALREHFPVIIPLNFMIYYLTPVDQWPFGTKSAQRDINKAPPVACVGRGSDEIDHTNSWARAVTPNLLVNDKKA